MKAIKLAVCVFFLLTGLFVLFAVPTLAQFPTAPEDHTAPSLGKFIIAVHPKWDPIMTGYPGYTPPPSPDPYGRLESPYLNDDGTIIGVSRDHVDGDPTDVGGAIVGTAGTLIPDALMPLRPLGFEGPPGTREVHTEVWRLNMTDGVPPPNNIAVRAGQGMGLPPNRLSPGEIESKNEPSGDFPAESFFDVYVEVDLPPGAAFPGGTVFNPTPMLVKHDSIGHLPPKVVYIHETTQWVAVLFLNNDPGGAWMAGDFFGWMLLGGHGFDMTEPDIWMFEDIWWGLLEEVPEPPPLPEIGLPSLTSYGLIVLLLLLLLSGVIVIYRRRRVTAQ